MMKDPKKMANEKERRKKWQIGEVGGDENERRIGEVGERKTGGKWQIM
jgi:hypothetical protein